MLLAKSFKPLTGRLETAPSLARSASADLKPVQTGFATVEAVFSRRILDTNHLLGLRQQYHDNS